jgi:arsenate reductase
MREAGLDISLYFPKPLTSDIMAKSRRIISVGCDADYLMDVDERWEVEDPLGQPIEKLLGIRDTIREHVMALVARLEAR